jgi:alkanesulfonate monooxygenase SsuD/methylene tetrahydromethanopterin reductase-like flavin-dependent oxidoreductase (luciferase family)
VAAHGPATIAIAARHADAWNMTSTLGRGRRAGLQFSAEQMVGMVRDRGAVLDEQARACGRDPRAIRRCFVFVAGVTPETPWASPDAFREFVGRYRAAGVTEFVFHWPRDGATAAIERVAREALPALRAYRPPGA